MNKLKMVSISFIILVIVSCNGHQRDIFQLNISKGDVLLTKKEYDDRYNTLPPKYILYKMKSRELVDLNNEYAQYAFDILSVSTSSNHILAIDKENKTLVLLDLINHTSENILTEKSELISNYYFNIEFLDDTTIIIVTDTALFNYNLVAKSLIKMADFNNKSVTAMFLSKLTRNRVSLNFFETQPDTIIGITNSVWDIDEGVLKNEFRYDSANVFDISPDGQYLLCGLNSLFIYDIDKKEVIKLTVYESLNDNTYRAIKFYNSNILVMTDIFKNDEDYHSKLFFYNKNLNKVENELVLGEGYYEVRKVF